MSGPLLGRLYRSWYEAIVQRLSIVPGTSIELGSGIGRLRQPSGDRVRLKDVERTPLGRQAGRRALSYALVGHAVNFFPYLVLGRS